MAEAKRLARMFVAITRAGEMAGVCDIGVEPNVTTAVSLGIAVFILKVITRQPCFGYRCQITQRPRRAPDVRARE